MATKSKKAPSKSTKKPTAAQKAKVGKVLGEAKAGKLKSSSGAKVTSRKQAIAIAMSEAGLSKPKKKKAKRKKS